MNPTTVEITRPEGVGASRATTIARSTLLGALDAAATVAVWAAMAVVFGIGAGSRWSWSEPRRADLLLPAYLWSVEQWDGFGWRLTSFNPIQPRGTVSPLLGTALERMGRERVVNGTAAEVSIDHLGGELGLLIINARRSTQQEVAVLAQSGWPVKIFECEGIARITPLASCRQHSITGGVLVRWGGECLLIPLRPVGLAAPAMVAGLCTVSSVNPSVHNLSTAVGCMSFRTPGLDAA
jgi:hypothetical protein